MSDFPDDMIEQVAANKRGIYYQIARKITVLSKRGETQPWVFICLTCVKTDDCAHSRAVRRYCQIPNEKRAVA